MKEYVYYCPETNEIKVFDDLQMICEFCPCEKLEVEIHYFDIEPNIKLDFFYIGEL